MNKLINKKGSSLLLVLMVMSVLFIIGTAIFSLSVMSYKNRESEETIKYNLYASEAGLDEAYAIISKYTQKAKEVIINQIDDEREIIDILTYELSENILEDIKNNNKNIKHNFIKENIKFFITGEKIEYVSLGAESTPREIFYVGIDGNLKENIDEKFQNNYKKVFSENLNKIISDLENTQNYSIFKNGTTGKIKVLSCKNGLDSENNLSIELKSTFEKDGIEKAVQLTYVINVPKYNNTSYMPDVYTKIYRNPVWTKAICADGNMEIKAGKVNITSGDIYIKGKDSDGGIILTEQASEFISQNGNVSTAENIKVSDDCLSVPKIDIEKDVYARNIIIEDGSKGADIEIGNMKEKNGAAYLLDDLEMNANNSKVKIAGGFYGLSDGSDNPEPDHSSSIIINAEDLGSGSSLKINNGLYIRGTAYINGLKYYGKSYKYQTGESISIKGKYKAYAQSFNTGEFRKSTFEYYDPLTLVSEKAMNNDEVIAYIKYDSKYNKITGKYDIGSYIVVKLTEDGIKSYSEAVKYEIEYKGKVLNEKDSLEKPIKIKLGKPIEIKSVTDYENKKIKIKLYDENNKKITEIENITIYKPKEVIASIKNDSKYNEKTEKYEIKSYIVVKLTDEGIRSYSDAEKYEVDVKDKEKVLLGEPIPIDNVTDYEKIKIKLYDKNDKNIVELQDVEVQKQQDIIASVKYYKQYNEITGNYDDKSYFVVKLTEEGIQSYREAVKYEVEGKEKVKVLLGEPILISNINYGNEKIKIKLYDENNKKIIELENIEVHKPKDVVAYAKYYRLYDKNNKNYDIMRYIVKLTEEGVQNYSGAVKYEIDGGERVLLGDPIVIDKSTDYGNKKIDIKLYDKNDKMVAQLKNVESLKLTLNVMDKSRYFKYYYNDNSEKVNGISIEKTDNNIHAGAIYTGEAESQIETSNFFKEQEIETKKDITLKTEDLKSEMFYMGNLSDKNPSDEELFRVSSPVVSVNSEINFQAAAFNKNVELKKENSIIVLNKDKNVACILGNKGINEHSTDIPSSELNTAIKIKKTNFNGIIITKGNVYIDGSINFKGTIITDKNIIFTGNDEKNIQYDKQYVENVISKNYEYFENVFKQYAPNKHIKIQSFNNSFEIKQQKTIEMKNWVVVK